jgi:hypothetical protein
VDLSSGQTHRTDAAVAESQNNNIENSPQDKSSDQLLPRLTRSGYSTIPPLEVLKKMTPDELKEVVDFTVQREGIGSVRFLGTTGTISRSRSFFPSLFVFVFVFVFVVFFFYYHYYFIIKAIE